MISCLFLDCGGVKQKVHAVERTVDGTFALAGNENEG
jgi:hypothetical protein